MSRYMFVGERPSPLAAKIGATWRFGGLSGTVLRRTLQDLGLDPRNQRYANLWTEPGFRHPNKRPSRHTLRRIRISGLPVVALGQIVAQELLNAGIPHICVVHPAARGSIRRRDRYTAHFREALSAA